MPYLSDSCLIIGIIGIIIRNTGTIDRIIIIYYYPMDGFAITVNCMLPSGNLT